MYMVFTTRINGINLRKTKQNIINKDKKIFRYCLDIPSNNISKPPILQQRDCGGIGDSCDEMDFFFNSTI